MPLPEPFQPFPAGTVKPGGWLRSRLQHDLHGFAGQLDRLAPDLFNDPIYSTGRLSANSAAKDLGNLKSGDAAGDEQYKWWNSETQSNWRDGWLRTVFLLDDAAGIEKATAYVNDILATQDPDGYLGIYDRSLRYRFASENGELWAKATLLRGLLAFFECTGRQDVLQSVKRAIENLMEHYPMGTSRPFDTGTAFNGGVSHGLMITDVLERLFFHTADPRYRNYALFLYRDYSNTAQSEADAQLHNLHNPEYRFSAHGVHTYEHLRAVITAAYAAATPEMNAALETYLKRIETLLTPAGGPIGDEWIDGRAAHATDTGYEYCSIHELLDSYALLLSKTGRADIAERIETVFFNAAQGARHPDGHGIAYLKTDDSFEMTGTRNGEASPHRHQTRYKYSAVHQDVAVCCAPNAGRITPAYIQHAWLRQGDDTLVLALHGPTVLETTVADTRCRITCETTYPESHALTLHIAPENPVAFTLKIRQPIWATRTGSTEPFTLEDGYLVLRRMFAPGDRLSLTFHAEVRTLHDRHGRPYFMHGALVYARPIPARETHGKTYGNAFTDRLYTAESPARYRYQPGTPARWENGTIKTCLYREPDGTPEESTLIPIGKTVLRQVVF
jgi:DUF1680 family protein